MDKRWYPAAISALLAGCGGATFGEGADAVNSAMARAESTQACHRARGECRRHFTECFRAEGEALTVALLPQVEIPPVDFRSSFMDRNPKGVQQVRVGPRPATPVAKQPAATVLSATAVEHLCMAS